MAERFKLLAGLHVMADPDAKEPEEGKRKPSITLRPGDVIETDEDLVERFGSQKFSRIGPGKEGRVVKAAGTKGDPSLESIKKNPAVFPGGQVSTGLQQSSVIPDDGRTLSGAVRGNDVPDNALTGEPAPSGNEADPTPSDRAGTQSGTFTEAEDEAPDFDSMTVTELREYAADNEVDLQGAIRKDDILRRVKESRQG